MCGLGASTQGVVCGGQFFVPIRIAVNRVQGDAKEPPTWYVLGPMAAPERCSAASPRWTPLSVVGMDPDEPVNDGEVGVVGEKRRPTLQRVCGNPDVVGRDRGTSSSQRGGHEPKPVSRFASHGKETHVGVPQEVIKLPDIIAVSSPCRNP